MIRGSAVWTLKSNAHIPHRSTIPMSLVSRNGSTSITRIHILTRCSASSGSGIVGVIFSVSTTYMIENISLPWALRITGLTSTVMLVIASILMKGQ